MEKTKSLAICIVKKCDKEKDAFFPLRMTFAKELDAIEKKYKSGKLAESQIEKEYQKIGKSGNVHRALKAFQKCLEKKCTQEFKAVKNANKGKM